MVVTGLLVSLALVVAFGIVAMVAIDRASVQGFAVASGHQADAARAASALHGLSKLARVIGVLFLVINPVLALVGWLSLALPAGFTSTRAGQAAICLSYLIAFFGGWWLVGTVVDRIARRHPLAGRDA